MTQPPEVEVDGALVPGELFSVSVTFIAVGERLHEERSVYIDGALVELDKLQEPQAKVPGHRWVKGEASHVMDDGLKLRKKHLGGDNQPRHWLIILLQRKACHLKHRRKRPRVDELWLGNPRFPQDHLSHQDLFDDACSIGDEQHVLQHGVDGFPLAAYQCI